jgi:hypothetical protein
MLVAVRVVYALHVEANEQAQHTQAGAQTPTGSGINRNRFGSGTATAFVGPPSRLAHYSSTISNLIIHMFGSLNQQYGWLQSNQTKTLPGT